MRLSIPPRHSAGGDGPGLARQLIAAGPWLMIAVAALYALRA